MLLALLRLLVKSTMGTGPFITLFGRGGLPNILELLTLKNKWDGRCWQHLPSHCAGGFLGISQVAKHAFFHCPAPNSLNHCQWPALSSGLLARELHHQPVERRARAAQHGPCQHTNESVQIIPAFLQRPGSTCPMPARIPGRQRLRQALASASAAALRLDPCRVPCLSFRLSSCACGAASRASP